MWAASLVSAPFSCSYRTWQDLAKERALIVELLCLASLQSAAFCCGSDWCGHAVSFGRSGARTTSTSCSVLLVVLHSKNLSAYVHAKPVDFMWISSRLGLPHLICCSSDIERKSILFVHEKRWSPWKRLFLVCLPLGNYLLVCMCVMVVTISETGRI